MADRSPAAWLELLERRLDDRWARWRKYDCYYEGDQDMALWLRSVQRAFSGTVLGKLLFELKDNYMPLVVDTAAERMRVQGFRLPDQEEPDKEAGRIWRENHLQGQSNMLHTESIKLGEAAWLVQPNGETPKITCEHPSQVIVATAPGDRTKRLAALKKWVDDDGFAYANVYLPDRVYKWRSAEAVRQGQRITWRDLPSVSNPLGEVPVVPVPNNPSMLAGGRSDLSFGATSLQDQITKTVADLLIGAEYHGFPQRVLLGVEAPRDENGRVISDLTAARSRLWYFNNENAKAHEFSQADLEGLRKSTDGFIGDLAAQTRIPIYYFRPQAISNISAEALIGLDAGLVSKTHDKQDPFGEGHDEMMRLALKSINKEQPVQTIWENTESRSEAQVVDAATKKQALGVPFEQLMEDIGYDPATIDRMVQMRETDALLNGTRTDASTPAVAPVNGAVPAPAG